MFSNRKQPGRFLSGRGGKGLEVEETYTSLDRARHFATSKLSLQRLVFVNELVDCAHEIGYEATVEYLLPLVKQLADDAEVLVRQSLVRHFGDLAGFLIQSDPERGYQKVVDEVLPIVSLLLMEKAAEVRQGAAEALATLASHLRPGERGDQVLMLVLSMSHNNDDEDARSTAVQLLNGLAEALGPDLCQQFVGVGLVALCEDPAFRVRKATAASFAEVARMVGDDYALRRLLPAFASLVRDGHWGVRKAAAESLVTFAMSLTAEKRKDPFVPLMQDLLGDSSSRWVRLSAQQQLGYFVACLEVAESVPEGLLDQYVDIVEQTKANPDAADISYHCAYTFAAVCKTMGQSSWPVLKAPFATLCKDAQVKTRRSMAASMHIVAKTVGPTLAAVEVLPFFEAALQDGTHEVRHAALRNVAALLQAMPIVSAQARVLTLLQGAMGRPEVWRPRHLVASQLGAACEALAQLAPRSKSAPGSAAASPEAKAHGALVWSILVPLFLRLCEDCAAEVRDEAVRATAKVLRAAAPELFPGAAAAVAHDEGSSGCSSDAGLLGLPPMTMRFVRHLIRAYALAKSFRCRMSYIHMCDVIIREAPARIFVDVFMKPLILLSVDAVKNVRLCWAVTMAPHVRRSGRLGENVAMLSAAYRMAQATDNSGEVRRVLESAPLAALPEGTDISACAGVEGGTGDPCLSLLPGGDSDEEDGKVPWLSSGTGGSYEDGAAVGEDRAAAARPPPPPPPDFAERDRQGGEPSASSDFFPPPRPLADAGAGRPAPIEVPAGGAGSSTASPPGARAAGSGSPSPANLPSPHVVPSTPPSSGEDRRTAFDPVEDTLVEQQLIDRDMDTAFRDRRLLHEAEEAAGEESALDSLWSLDRGTSAAAAAAPAVLAALQTALEPLVGDPSSGSAAGAVAQREPEPQQQPQQQQPEQQRQQQQLEQPDQPEQQPHKQQPEPQDLQREQQQQQQQPEPQEEQPQQQPQEEQPQQQQPQVEEAQAEEAQRQPPQAELADQQPQEQPRAQPPEDDLGEAPQEAEEQKPREPPQEAEEALPPRQPELQQAPPDAQQERREDAGASPGAADTAAPAEGASAVEDAEGER